MRKVIAAINMTVDGNCDHTAGIPDEEIHDHYANLLDAGGVALYGRITYQLMQFWQTLRENPSGDKSMDDFAASIDRIPKIVFSNTLQETGWDSASIADKPLEEVIATLKSQPGGDILVGSRSLIAQTMNRNLLDEFQLCIHPLIAGSGLNLFENMEARKDLRLIDNKKFKGGGIILSYARG